MPTDTTPRTPGVEERLTPEERHIDGLEREVAGLHREIRALAAERGALRRETDWLVRTIEAHDLMPYTCDRDGAESCDCIDRQLARVRGLLNPEGADR